MRLFVPDERKCIVANISRSLTSGNYEPYEPVDAGDATCTVQALEKLLYSTRTVEVAAARTVLVCTSLMLLAAVCGNILSLEYE